MIESLPNWLQDPIEELIEEFWDVGQEALFIAAGDIDEYIAGFTIYNALSNGAIAQESWFTRLEEQLKSLQTDLKELKRAIKQ